MSIRLLCSLLIATSFAQTKVQSVAPTHEKTPSKFVLLPAEYCAAATSTNVKQLCSPKPLPYDLDNYSIVPTGEAGYVQLAFKNSVETDNLELLCYRCTLGKGVKDNCARYENVWGNRSWTEQCPKVKD